MKSFAKPFAVLALSVSGLIASIVLGEEIGDAASAHSHHHMHMMEQIKYQMSDYQLPPVQLVRNDGERVSLAEELNDGRPVILNFIYTTCTTICPLTSRTFAELQDKLGRERDSVHMVSISIDPEQDTPAVLARYAGRFGAGRQWQFYTGTLDASLAAQRAFDVYRGSKMNHNPVTFIRTAPGELWLRIDGFAKADELLQGLRDMSVAREARAHVSD